MSAKDLFMALRERKIFVRYFNKPRINEYLRITIGTDEQMAKVVAAMKEILG
jgi:histidinol-phosphate aminotransferase